MLKPTVTPTPDFFHDPFGQFLINATIAVVVGIFVSAVTIWTVLIQRRKKEISYVVVSDAAVASIDKAVKDKVEVLFDGKPANDARLWVISLWNSGNVAVKPEDYDEQISFVFEGTKVLMPQVLFTYPTDFFEPQEAKTFLMSSKDRVKLAKFLLNPGHLIRFAVLLKRAPSAGEKVRGRIVDGTIVKFDSDKQPLIVPVGLIIILVLISVFFGISLTWFTPSGVLVARSTLLVLVSLSPIVGFMSGVLSNPHRRRRIKNGIKFAWL